jgi:putative sterol carrier protein
VPSPRAVQRAISELPVGVIGSTSVVLALQTMFDPQAADDLRASYELRLGENRFRAQVADGRFEIARGSTERPDATIETDPATLASLFFEGRQLAEALRSGDLKIEGDEIAVERFLALFALPEPVAPARAQGASTSSAASMALEVTLGDLRAWPRCGCYEKEYSMTEYQSTWHARN